MVAVLAATTASIATTALSTGIPQPRPEAHLPTRAAFHACITELRAILPEACLSEDSDDLHAHGIGQWTESKAQALPGLVVYPRNTEDVVAIVQTAIRYSIPLVPYGAGTSIEGQINAPCLHPLPPGSPLPEDAVIEPGFSISVAMAPHMHDIIEVHEDDLQVTVQPGIGYETLNASLQEMGVPLFFPVDPGPGATIGGMVATGCSGTNAVRYGTMREAVLNLKVVLPSGEVIKTRSRAAKSSAGPDLTKLFVGSEGTLGIIVEATLKLAPIAPASVGMLSFPTIQTAANAVSQLLKQGITLQCCELLDERMIKAVNASTRRDKTGLRLFEEKPTLLFKVQGDETTRAATQKRIARIARQHGCDRIEMARDAAESENLWRARKIALVSAMATAPNSGLHSTDVCVPVSRMPLLIDELHRELDRLSFPFAGIVGHVMDGNVHTVICYYTDAQDKAATAFADHMARRAQELEGTCTGEHGVGTGKKHHLYRELGGSVDLLRDIKRLIDPLNIMNPASLIPEPNMLDSGERS